MGPPGKGKQLGEGKRREGREGKLREGRGGSPGMPISRVGKPIILSCIGIMATRKVVIKNVSTGSQLTLSKHYVEQVTKLHIVSLQ